MLKALLLCVLALTVMTVSADTLFRTMRGDWVPPHKAMAVDPALVDHINGNDLNWKAEAHPMFEGMSVAAVQHLCGARPDTKEYPVRTLTHPDDIPTSFDARANWPKCPTIGHIRDQGECGSCWAFGAVEAITDRFCIASNASISVPLSTQHLASCDTEQGGCDGGMPGAAWDWVVTNGLTTNSCQPYDQATCFDASKPEGNEPCLPPFKPTAQITCSTCYGSSKDAKKYYLKSVYQVGHLFSRVKDMQTELMQSGSIECTMSVYQDFVGYKSGVYSHKSGSYLGGHAIKVLGWGVENGEDYWLVANSWTTYWGDNGYFKIKRGVDEVGIESGCVAGQVDLSRV